MDFVFPVLYVVGAFAGVSAVVYAFYCLVRKQIEATTDKKASTALIAEIKRQNIEASTDEKIVNAMSIAELRDELRK